MADGISIREFARREDVSDTLVRRAIKQGRLRALADKSIDPALVGSAWREGNAKAPKQGANTGANTAPSANTSKTARPATKKVAAVLSDETVEAIADRLMADGAVMVSYAEALQNKENYLALLRQLEYEEKSGALVELALAERALFEGALAQRDAWLNWPARVGALIAADLGLEADRVTETLTEHVHKHIAQLGEPDVQFIQG